MIPTRLPPALGPRVDVDSLLPEPMPAGIDEDDRPTGRFCPPPIPSLHPVATDEIVRPDESSNRWRPELAWGHFLLGGALVAAITVIAGATLHGPAATSARRGASPTIGDAPLAPPAPTRRIFAEPAPAAAEQAFAAVEAPASPGDVAVAAARPDEARRSLEPFDASLAARRMADASRAAQRCFDASSFGGVARVLVTFNPSGRSTRAVVVGAPFAGTSVGGCIASSFHGLIIPPFEGTPTDVAVTVERP